MRRHTLPATAIGILAVSLAAAGCAGGSSSGEESESEGSAAPPLVVGSANFVESQIIASIYSQALQASGFEVEEKFNIGSREAYIPALESGDINLIPEYTGNLLLYLDENATAASSEEVAAALEPVLEEKGLAVLTPAPGEDKDSLVVTQETASTWNLTSIEDLAAHNDELTIGAAAEFEARQATGLEEKYGVKPAEYVAIADYGGPATVGALVDGTVTAADIFTTTPAIQENDFVVLEDPENLFPAQNVVPVLSAQVNTPEVAEVLNAVSEKLTTEALLGLNQAVSGDQKIEPATAAEEWLRTEGLVD